MKKMYKTDNAIILAAGRAKRCMPLSARLPKGLFKVRGEVLIERQIKQIMDAGIQEIILVVGYMAEKFDYLKKKYGVDIIYNPEYATTNNISSLWYARKYLHNSYICGSDNWFEINVFRDWVQESYFSSIYSSELIDEYCIEMYDGYINQIKKGGQNTWYTLGEIFFSEKLSSAFCIDLETEYQLTNIKELIIDEYCMRHIDRYKFQTIHRRKEDIWEFDTIDEIMEFDPKFQKNNL